MADVAILMSIGRIVFGGFFVIAGVRNFLRFGERTQFMTNYGWTLPGWMLAIGFATQLLGGLALVFDVWTWAAALALIGFLLLATGLYHNLFMFSGKERDPHIYFTLVNITLAGGLLMVIAGAV